MRKKAKQRPGGPNPRAARRHLAVQSIYIWEVALRATGDFEVRAITGNATNGRFIGDSS